MLGVVVGSVVGGAGSSVGGTGSGVVVASCDGQFSFSLVLPP